MSSLPVPPVNCAICKKPKRHLIMMLEQSTKKQEVVMRWLCVTCLDMMQFELSEDDGLESPELGRYK